MLGPERLGTANLLTESFTRRGVVVFFCDVDDTLVDTSWLYKIFMSEYASYIARLNGKIDSEVVRETMGNAIRGLRSTFRVHPTILKESARLAALQYGVDFYSDKSVSQVSRLMDLYTSAPPAFDGVLEAMEVIHASGVRIIAMSHSPEDWTEKKLAQNGLLKFFNEIYGVDTTKFKDGPAWRYVFGKYQIDPAHAMIVGDSWATDVKPALENQVLPQTIIRVMTDNTHANIGRIDGIQEVKYFRDVPGAIVSG